MTLIIFRMKGNSWTDTIRVMKHQLDVFMSESRQERQQLNRLTLGQQIEVKCKKVEQNGKYGMYKVEGPPKWPLSDSLQTMDGHTLTRIREGVYVSTKMLYQSEVVRNRKTANVLRSRYQHAIDCFKDGRANPILHQAMTNDYIEKPSFDLITEEDTIGQINNGVTVISGKPGAGKTRQVTKLIMQEMLKKNRVLVISPTHELINSLAKRIKGPKVLLNPEYRIDESHQQWHVAKLPGYNGKRKSYVPTESPYCIISTVNHAISNLDELDVQIIVMDEATKVGLLEGIAAVMEARGVKKILLIGDPMQLGVYDSNGKVQENILSWATRLKNVARKEMQYTYRFGAPLSDLISDNIYNGKLVSKAEPTQIHWRIVRCEKKRCDNIGCQMEADAVHELYKKSKNCQVITPYKRQLTLLRNKSPNMKVINTDLSQGKEFDEVIVSMGRHRGEGFLTSNRINVTLTRAKNKLTIFINHRLLEDHLLIRKLFKQSHL